MKELYRSGTLHIAELDERNFVVYDSKTLTIKHGNGDYESYKYKYYPTLHGAVQALSRRVANQEGNDLDEWLERYERATERACEALGGE